MVTRLQEVVNRYLKEASVKRILKNAAFLFSTESVVSIIGFIQFPLVTRLLGSEQYGAWGIAIGWVGLVSQFLSFRLWETVIKFLTQFSEANDEPRALALVKLCLWIDIVVATVTFALVCLSADFAGRLVLAARADGPDLIRLEALNSYVGVSASVWVAALRVFDRFGHISISNIVSSAAIFVLWAGILASGGGVSGLILASALVRLCQTVILAVLAGRELQHRFRASLLSARIGVLREHYRAIGVMLVSMNVDTFRKIVSNNLDILILGWFATPAQAGLYRLAKQLSSYLNRLFNPVYEALFPEIARLYNAEGLIPVQGLLRRLSMGLLVVYCVTLAGSVLLGPLVVPLVLGAEYVAAVPLFQLFAASNFWIILMWMPSLMLTLGMPRQLTTMNVATSIVTLVTMLVLAPSLQAYGIVSAFLVSAVFGTGLNLLVLGRIPGLGWRRPARGG